MMRFIAAAGIAAGLLLGGTTSAQELVREALPFRWIDEYVPEDLPKLEYPAYFNELEKARYQVFTGRYKTALLTLRKIEKGEAAELALLRAKALTGVGRRDEALEALGVEAVAKAPAILVQKALVLAELGRWEEGISILKDLTARAPESIPAHYYLGALYEQVGNIEAAKLAYERIFKTYYDQWTGQGAKHFEDAEMVTLMGRAFDRYAMLTGSYANNPPLHNLMLRIFVQAYDIIDREYYPARLAAAEYAIAHGDPREAEKELSAILAINPNESRALELMGLIALDVWNFDVCDQMIASLRRLDYGSARADILETRSLLQQRRPKDAEIPINRVLAKQPASIEAMGLLASAYALQTKDEQANEVLKQVEKLDPDNASAYHEMGNTLGAMRQYPRAEKMYNVAIERAPWWSDPRNGLGLLLTQSGDEEGAKRVLTAAYSYDPFNYRTINYLRLLDKMDQMQKRESEHFVIFFDPKEDPVIAEYFVDYLESIHTEVCKNFGHEPAVKTYIEVFPTHDQFSVRTTGSPWIGTVGASTGRVIALVAPRRGSATMGTYNWAQVLRHEYTHTVTLSATDNRIGHWMTEGLAVYEERSPLRWEWVPMLYNAVTKKELFSMEDLTWAFVRPKRPQDRSLAYAQSYWICKYIEEKWGHQAILEMMAEFKNGSTQEVVFPEVLGETTREFFKGFTAWTEKQIEGWGYDKETSEKYKKLVEEAEELTRGRQFAEAIEKWEEVIKIRPVDQLPHQRLAGLYLNKATRDNEKAKSHLIRLHEVSLKDNRFAKRVSRLAMEDMNDLATAQKYALESVYIDPYDVDAHELLAAVYEKAGNQKGLERQQKVLPVVKRLHDEFRKGALIEGAPQ